MIYNFVIFVATKKVEQPTTSAILPVVNCVIRHQHSGVSVIPE
jgi:hypothetical protein